MKIQNILRSMLMAPILAAALLLAACAEGPEPKPTPSGHVRKWVGPPVSVLGGGHFRTVIFYGPWQCSNHLMTYCRQKCEGAGHTLQGCMWLADIKMDFDGSRFNAGSRYPMTHCCCNYMVIGTSQTQSARDRWDNIREGFRNQWAERFGAWPTEASSGKAYPGHHVRDLKHGGNPTDWDNIIPFPKDIHDRLNGLYNQCYAGGPPWTQVGSDYPYGE